MYLAPAHVSELASSAEGEHQMEDSAPLDVILKRLLVVIHLLASKN